MDDATDPPATAMQDVDVMDVSPATMPEHTSLTPNDPSEPHPTSDHHGVRDNPHTAQRPNPNLNPTVTPTSNPPPNDQQPPAVDPLVTAPPAAAIQTEPTANRRPPRAHPAPTPSPTPASSTAAPAALPAPEEEKLETTFSYVLQKYTSIPETKVYSPWHRFGSFRWRLLIFPKGNQNPSHDLSVYLECGGPVHQVDRSSSMDHHHVSLNGKETAVATVQALPWNRPAKFSLHLVHPSSAVAREAMAALEADPDHDQALSDLDVSDSNAESNATMMSGGVGVDGTTALAGAGSAGARQDIFKETSHIFRENAGDWGFLEFASFSLLQPGKYADGDMNVVIMVKIRLHDHIGDAMLNSGVTWDSRKETGFVGFKNQGATCYMNSLLQTLYMVSAFRKAVYNMPLPEPGNENSGSELSYALQKVFYELQFSPTVVKTKKLTESFGWDTTDAFTQHDVQELKLILCDELAEKMKKIAPDKPNHLSTLFQGKLLNYIECVNVDYKSTREEDFSDLSLNVKGCRNIYESFKKYTEVEMMDGDNKYRADGYDELQDAKKGVKFLKLPPVLQLHLKRFEYDFARFAMVKINDRYEFEPELDLSEYVENSDGTDIYVLHSVLVHIGDVNGGHYHVFIRPEIDVSEEGSKKPPHWYKFDDETVSMATEEAAIQDNYGFGGERDLTGKRVPGVDDDLGNTGVNGQPPPTVFQTRNRNYQTRRFSNAYMLQYLRKSEVPFLLKPADESDVPKELAARITKEREEEEQRKRDRAEQHLYMNIAVAVAEDMVEHHGADLVQWDRVRQLRVKRDLQLGDLKQRLQREGIVQDAHRMRLWKCQGRQNDTIRPDSLVANGIDSHPITDPNRDPMTQAYNVALYTGRHGYYGQEEVVRMFAEDFCSPFCLAAGHAYTEFQQRMDEWNGEHRNGSVSADEAQNMNDMETDRLKLAQDEWLRTFPLLQGREVLLFLKYYTPTPAPRLQWLGHFVVDRGLTVNHLKPHLRHALEAFRKRDLDLVGVVTGSPITVFEEVAANSVNHLNPTKTLEAQRIPFESGSGDILVFQQGGIPYKDDRTRMVTNDVERESSNSDLHWDGKQEVSRGDGTDLPLGGRPLPTVTHYFDYLAYRVKIEFKDKHAIGSPDEVRSIFLEMLRKDTYALARKVLSGVLGENVDPDYLRFFPHDFNRDTANMEPLRLNDSDTLERVLPIHNLVASLHAEHKILWYERTEYHISEFDHKDEVRVVWRQDGGARATPHAASSQDVVSMYPVADAIIRAEVSVTVPGEDPAVDVLNGTAISAGQNYTGMNGSTAADHGKMFSVLVSPMSKYADVMDQVRIKLNISSDVRIRMFEVKNSKIFRFINPNDPVPPLMTGSHDCGAELRAEPVPSDETAEALGSEFELITVLHLAKDKHRSAWRGLTFFGVPFVIKVRKDGETVRSIRKRIQEKLGIPQEEFDQWPLAEIVQLKVVYLKDVDVIYTPQARVRMEFCSLAIEHKSTAPARKTTSVMSRYADKPLKIRS